MEEYYKHEAMKQHSHAQPDVDIFVADKRTYLLVCHLDGRVEHVFAKHEHSSTVPVHITVVPVEIPFDPKKHKRIERISIDAHGKNCPQSEPGDIYVADKTFFLKVFHTNGDVQQVHAPQMEDEHGNDVGQTVIVFDPSQHKRIVRMFYSMIYFGG